MSVQSFGANILDAKVKSLTSQHDLILSNMDANGVGREYTHRINGPNVASPNNYSITAFEKATGGATATKQFLTFETQNGGSPPFTTQVLTLEATEINISGITNFLNNPNNGQATLAIGAAPSIEVSGIQNVTANSVILLTQASPNTGGTNVAINLYVEAGVSGAGKFTIYTTDTLAVAVKVNYSVVKY